MSVIAPDSLRPEERAVIAAARSLTRVNLASRHSPSRKFEVQFSNLRTAVGWLNPTTEESKAKLSKIISHDTIVYELRIAPADDAGHKTLVYELGPDDFLRESFTSQHGRVHGGPATVTVHQATGGSGAVTVHVEKK